MKLEITNWNLNAAERQIILAAVTTEPTLEAAAQSLGLSLWQLRRRIRIHKIQVPEAHVR